MVRTAFLAGDRPSDPPKKTEGPEKPTPGPKTSASKAKTCGWLWSHSDCVKAFTGLPYYLPRTVVPATITGKFVTVPGAPKNSQDAAFKEYQLTLTLGSPIQEPDPSAPVLLEYRPSSLHDDDLDFKIGANGLLQSGSLVSKDRTQDVLLKVAELAAQVARMVTIGPFQALKAAPSSEQQRRRRACSEALSQFTATEEIDLTHPSQMGRRLIQDIQDRMFRPGFSPAAKLQGRSPGVVEIAFDDAPAPIAKSGSARSQGGQGARASARVALSPFQAEATDSDGGLLFRRMRPRTLSVSLDTAGIAAGSSVMIDGRKTTCSLVPSSTTRGGIPVMVVDAAHGFWLDVDRTPLVEKKLGITVKDGVLLGAHLQKPSEVVAGISLPVEVLKAIAAIPGQLLSFKVEQLKAQQGLTDQETALLKSQLDLIQQQKDLAAQKSSPQAGP